MELKNGFLRPPARVWLCDSLALIDTKLHSFVYLCWYRHRLLDVLYYAGPLGYTTASPLPRRRGILLTATWYDIINI